MFFFLKDVFIFVFLIFATFGEAKENQTCGQRYWQCDDGSCIRATLKCDGLADCSDSSDETNATCSKNDCLENQFQCNYGACIDNQLLCNEEENCVDGSDELEIHCNKFQISYGNDDDCKLPPFPENGRYKVVGTPGKRLLPEETVLLFISCDPGHQIIGNPIVICSDGKWKNDVPLCSRPCKLKRHPSLKYFCRKNNHTVECEEFVSSGTTVLPQCTDPDYYSPHILKCSEGVWDREAVCKQECGRVTPAPVELTSLGDRVTYNPAPWHALIYSKLTRSQVCSGTLISATAVISAAHCFWDEAVGLLPSPTFSVTVGRIRRQWSRDVDAYQQQRDCNEIRTPPSFDGSTNNLEQNIALVTFANPFKFSAFVSPICLDFDPHFNENQLGEGAFGRIAAWDESTDMLKSRDLPYARSASCGDTLSVNKLQDIICATVGNKTDQLKNIDGAGYAFANKARGTTRYYLRGVASELNVDQSALYFIKIINHEKFIQTNTDST